MGLLGALKTVVGRPFQATTWRELAYLLLGGAMSVVAFAEVVGMVTGSLVLLVTLVGVPLFLLKSAVERGLAGVERRRAAFLLREPVESRYRDASGAGFWHKVRVVAGDPQTWRDFAWLVLLAPVGFGFAVAAASLWGSAAYLLSLPLWWRSVPHAALPDLGPHWTADTWPRVALMASAGLGLAVATPWVCAALAHGQARLARALLRPSSRARADELERSRAAVVRRQELDRHRLERDLHDGVQARLVALALDLGMARDKLQGGDPGAAESLLEEAHAEAKGTLAELRELVRGVHPPILADRGLDAALSALAGRSPVPVRVDVTVGRVRPEVEAAAYFVVAEALANVAKHSNASMCSVRVDHVDGRVVVEVSDDGSGGARVGAGSGLAGLADRVEALDGGLRVASPTGGPTTVIAEIPCAS
jgi:signal transduction histidine kinase